MKYIKNIKTGDIQRVDNQLADAKVGNTWKFVPKSEWKAVTRKPKPEVVEAVVEETISKKQLKRKKNVKDRS